jgi:hypothetical protein
MNRFTSWILLTTLLVAPIASAATGGAFPTFEDLPEQPALPDPFTMQNGDRVKTPEDWMTMRRPELKALFEHYVYGAAAPEAEIVTSNTAPSQSILNGQGLLRQVTLRFKDLPGDDSPAIRLALFLPAGAGPVPVFLGLNKCGNYTVLGETGIVYDSETWCHGNCPESVEEGRGVKEEFWSIPYLLSRGYGFATFHESDIDPDKHDFGDGIHAAYPPAAAPDHRWGTIAAWSWGLRRSIDYLVNDPAVNADQVSVIGHSRRGKTALLTAALDERVALVVPHQSGTGGMALSRNNSEETTERINRIFPHWFCDAFTWFDNQENRLPVDQHLLAALVAPRALFETVGLKDTWANYESSLKTIRAADPVYKFLGAPGISGDGMLAGPTDITRENAGNLAQYRLDTKHTLTRDYWEAILDFADVQFGK